ncbi:MAG: ATP-binding protein [Solidesulfovibrio sp. DCME]|uniref:ATP-binding protein n=1 Tax=Solidesulfovibrio sp. DCME TaxID=3447380 RepID=UPI003D0EFFC5
MREIVVLSGKGGAGKTSVTAAFAALARNAVVCDLDVDAPDLHILLDPRDTAAEEFVSGNLAQVEPSDCDGCGICRDVCRFAAVAMGDDGKAVIEPRRCEGCKACVALCPRRAIAFPPRVCGYFAVSGSRFGPFIHARLDPGAENSGRLVALLKRKARDLAERKGHELILCDGAPGIACPVISALSGATLAVLVVEPTPSGIHDFSRVATLCDHFRLPAGVIVNKADLNPEETTRLEATCRQAGRPVLGRLPYSPDVTRAMKAKLTLPEYGGPLAGDIARLWEAANALADSCAKAKK